MVSIFTGNGLGVFQSSATQLGQGSGTRLGQGRESHGINVATGNLVLQALDEGLIVRGQSAAALRTYNSRGQVSGMGQDGWATGYERWVELDGELNTAGSVVRYHNGEGDQVVYAFDVSQGRYIATTGSGAHDVIVWDESGWYRYQDGNGSNHEYFESNEYQQSGEFDPQPRALLRWISQSTSAYLIQYDALGRVSEAVSSVGYPNGDAIVYAYEGNTQRLASIATRENGVVRTQVTYGYDPAGRLSWVQTDLTPDNANDNGWDANSAAANDGRLFRTSYAYASGDAADLRIAGVTASDGATVSYTYESDGAGGWRVKTVTEGSAADGSARTLTFVYGAGSTDVIDAAGRTWTYRYDANKQLIAVLAPAVDGQRQTTSYDYDAAGNVTRIATSSFATATGTGGASIEEQRFRYDGNGNRIQQRDLQGNVIAWTYNQANQVASETRYTVADVDGLDVDQAGNWSMPSGALTTRYVYESDWSDRLRFVINAEGEVRELTYESSAPYYDGMLASERRYLGDRYAGTAYTHQALSAWANDTAAQRRANSSLTRYAYDAKGRLERSIEYATVTANAVGEGVLDAAATITRYVHDAQGLLRQSIVSRGAGRTAVSVLAGSEVTEYVYDGMGRLLSVLRRDAATAAGDDASTLQTIYSYVDSENRIRVAQDNGLVRIEARNRAGELLSVSETGAVAGASTTRANSNYYDDTGRLRASEDAAGGRSYFFYDTAGRLIATVDPTGAVSRTEYDSAGRIAGTTRYATQTSTQGWLIGGMVTRHELVFAAAQPASLASDQVWVAQVDDDRVTEMSYDSAGRLVRATDNAGSEISYEYDGAGRLVRSTEWGEVVLGGGWDDALSLKASSARRPPTTRETRTTRMFYDNADRLVATLDAEGYLSESVYDAGGRLAKTVRYATRTNSAYWVSGTLQQLRPANAAADQTTRLFYDARGRQVGELNAEGHLTEMLFDEQNNQRATREYAKQLTGLNGTESLLALRTAAMTDAPAEVQRETMNSYNGLGQLIVSRNHEGTVTRYVYDEAGRLVKTEMAADTSEVRAGGQRYDVFGHLIGELSGDGAALLHADMTEVQLDALYAQYGVRHRYDALGRRVESTDALGHKTWYFHDDAGRQRFVVRGVEDAAGLKNALGEVSEVRYTAFGDVADTLAYDGRIAIAVPGDRASAASALQQLTALAGTSQHTQFGYDRAGRLIRRQEVDGAASDFEYNRFGELRNAWRSSVAGEWVSSSTYTYDRRGQRIGTEEYDAYSWRNTNAAYDAFGRLVSATDARGTVREFVYDRLGRQIGQVLRNVGGQDLSTQTSYDAFDRVVAQTDAMGRITQYSHSDAARGMTMVTPEGVAITTVHNAFGQTIEIRQPLPDGSIAIHRTAYDNRGLMTGTTDALGQDTTHQYDARGQLIRTIDATGRSVAYAYDAAGRTLSRSEDPDGLNLTTRYAYDGQGRQLQTTDPSGRVSRMTYDRKGQLIELAQDPDGLNLRTVYTWDGEGNRLSVTSGAGTAAAQTTAYQYDGFGRRISETIDPDGLALRTEYVYDANDNVIARSGYGGSARYAYDAANRLRFSIDALGGISETVYDANGRVVAQRAYARAVDLSAYGTSVPDDAGMVALIEEQGLRDDARDVTSYVVYDRDGRVRLTINGAGEVAESVYDSAGRKVADKGHAQRLVLTPVLRDALRAGTLTAAEVLTQMPSSPQSDAVVRYFHDALGRLIYTVNSVGGMTRMWYDAAGRVEKVRTFAKPAVVASLATATIASLDAQLDWSAGFEGENRIHDGAGRLRYRISADGTLREFRYDAAGNVVVSLRYLQRAFELTAPDILDPEAQGGDTDGDIIPVPDLAAFTALHELEAAAEYSIYDSAGRLRLQMVKVTKNGAHLTSFTLAAVEHQYDAAGRTIATHAYTQALSTGLNTSLRDRLQQGTATEADFDAQLAIRRATAQTIRMVYDAAGREVYRIDGANGVLGLTYSAMGQVASTRRYATPLPANTTPTMAVVAAQLAGSPQDLVEHQIHDAAGRLVFRVLGDRSVEETRHDGMGRTTAMWRYAAMIDSALMQQVEAGQADANGFAAFVAANESDARVQRLHYDQAGRVRYQTTRSAAGTAFVSETVHDALGRETASIRYGVEIAWQAGADALAVDAAIDAALSADPAQRAAQMRTTRIFHDGDGRQRFMLDASGALSEQRYDGAGRVTETIAYGNRPTATATADTASLEAWVQTQASADVRRSRNLYDNAGQVIARVDALGRSEYYEYDTAGNITAHTDRNGARWRYEYDKAGRRTAEISPQVSVTTASAGSSASTSVARAIATRYVYDGLRNIVTRIEDADGPTPRTTRYEYDNRGHQIRTILPDPLTGGAAAGGSNDTIEVRYDALGLAVSEKDALGNMQYRVYDNLGRVLYDIDAEQQVTSHRYNAFGEETRTVRHAAPLNALAMQAAGWQPGQAPTDAQTLAGLTVGPQDRGVESEYNALGQKTLVLQDAVGYVKRDGTATTGRPALRTAYNAYGEVAKTSLLVEGTPDQVDAVWAETYRYYDALGRETVTVDAEGYVNAQQYNAYGDIWRKTEYARALSASERAGLGFAQPPAMPAAGDAATGFDRTMEYTFDALGRIGTETIKRFVQTSSDSALQAVDVSTEFGYDAEGHVTLTRDALGETRTTYDALGRITAVRQPARATVAGSAYDTRLTSTAYDLSSAALYVQRSPYTTIQYDAFGAVSQTRQYANGVQSGNTPVANNALDRITQTRYDGRGRAVEERNLAAGTTIHRTYDAGDRLIEARTLLRGGADHQDPTSQVESDIGTRFVYDKLGQQTGTETVRERHLVKNGARTPAGRFVDTAESIRYNAFGEIVAKDDRLDTAFAAGTPHAQFEYDNAGRMLRSNAQGGAWRDYGYDLAGRGVRMVQRSFVTNAQGVAQVVDAVSDSHADLLGRITLQRLPANSDDVNQRPEVRRDYDRWGNVVRMVDARGHETLYRYNDQNKLTVEIRPEVKVVNRDGTELRARPTTAYFYDTYGRLVETRDANGNSDRYVYDNVGRVVQSIDALGKVTRTAYDVFDNDIYMQDPKGYIKAQLRDSTGQVSSIGDFIASSGTSRNWTVLEAYDLKNSGDRWATTVAPNNSLLNHTARYDYDIRHQLLGSRSAAGVVKTFDYDLQGRKTRETNGNADRLRYLLRQHDVAGIITGDGTGRWVDVMDPYDGYYSHSEYVMDPYAGPQIRKDREGEYVFENEQTWDYDYFGRLIDHNDLGGADYDYIYHSVTGQLIRTTRATSVAMQVDPIQGSGIDTSLSTVDHVDGSATTEDGLPTTAGANDRVQIYYASGLIKEIREGQNWTRYAYDASGNRTMEETYTRDGGGSVVHLRTLTTYDSNNRVSLVKQFEIYNDYAGVQRANEVVTVRYSYDAAGNRRRVTTGKSLNYQPAALVGYVGQLLTSYSCRDYVEKIAPETTFAISMTLADGSPLPSWLTWNPTTMMLQGTPPSAQGLTVRLTAVSSEDQSVTIADIPLQVMPSQPPRLTFDDGLDWNQTVDPLLTEWTFASAAAFMDPEGMPLHYSAQLRVGLNLVALPAGMHIDPNTGVISGLPADGAYQIVVTATDVDQQSVSRTLSLSVASAPWTSSVFENEFLEVSMYGRFGTHSGAPPVGYAIQSVNGGAVPAWMSISDYGWGEWALTGTPSIRGTFNIVVRAIYADGSEAARTLVLTVARVPHNGTGDPHVDPGEDLTGSDARLDPLEAPALAATDLDSDANARLVLEDSMQLVAPIYDDGSGSGSGGGGGGGGGSTVPTTPGAGYISLPTNAWRSLWFDYDAENRVTIVNGRLVNGQILIGTNGPTEKDLSYAVQYDDAGRERLRTEMKSGVVKHQVLQYNPRGQLSLTYQFANSEAASQGVLAERRTYDDAGRLKYRQDLFHTPTDPTLHGQARLQDSYAYDADGRVTAIHNSEGAKRIASFNGNTGAVTFEYYQNSVSATYYDYDESRDGLLVFNQYHHVKDSEYRLTYLYNYDARESYLEVSVGGYGTIGSGSFTPATTTSTYDHWGRRIKVHDSKDRLFAYDMSGGILQRIDSNSVYWKTRYAYANGQQVAATNSGWVDVASHLTAYQSGEQGSGTTSAMAGETLRSIAMRVYGTESLWYVLASANGLDDNVDLTPGMTLRVPDVKVNSNDASTFKPYNPSEIIGNTTPQLDYVAPPPPKKNCGQIILLVVAVVVAVVVTVFTAGAMAAPAGAGLGAIMSAGTAVLTGTAVTAGLVASTGAMLAMAAAAGVAGALASQLVMVAGDKDYKFDWGAVALGGLTAAVGSGLGAAFSGASAAVKAADAAKKTVNGLTKALDAIGKLSWARGAAQAVVGTVANYGANWALNRIDSSRDRANEKFSWAGLAASAVSGAVSAQIGDWLGGKKTFDPGTRELLSRANQSGARLLLNDFVTGFAGSAVNYNVASLLDDVGRPDYGQMMIDAFGNAAAGALVRSISDVEVDKNTDENRSEENVREVAPSQDESEDAWDLASSDEDAIFLRDDKYADLDEEYFQRRDDLKKKVEWLKGIVGRYDSESGYEPSVLGDKLPLFAESDAVRTLLSEYGFASNPSGESYLHPSEIVMAKLFIIDPEIAGRAKDFVVRESGAGDLAIARVQQALGFKGEDVSGVFTAKTRDALSGYFRSSIVASGAATQPSKIVAGEKYGAIKRLNEELGTKIIPEKLAQFEGGQKLGGYVPWEHGSLNNKSGVTIATGVDIGQKTVDEIRALNLSPELTKKLIPYAGLKKADAKAYENANPLNITRDEANQLDYAVQGEHLRAAVNSWNRRRPEGAPEFKSLTPAQQTVLLSRTYHQGKSMPDTKIAQNFYKAALRGDWEAAAGHLKGYATKADWYQKRVGAEAKLIYSDIRTSGKNSMNKTVVPVVPKVSLPNPQKRSAPVKLPQDNGLPPGYRLLKG